MRICIIEMKSRCEIKSIDAQISRIAHRAIPRDATPNAMMPMRFMIEIDIENDPIARDRILAAFHAANFPATHTPPDDPRETTIPAFDRFTIDADDAHALANFFRDTLADIIDPDDARSCNADFPTADDFLNDYRIA